MPSYTFVSYWQLYILYIMLCMRDTKLIWDELFHGLKLILDIHFLIPPMNLLVNAVFWHYFGWLIYLRFLLICTKIRWQWSAILLYLLYFPLFFILTLITKPQKNGLSALIALCSVMYVLHWSESNVPAPQSHSAHNWIVPAIMHSFFVHLKIHVSLTRSISFLHMKRVSVKRYSRTDQPISYFCRRLFLPCWNLD